MYVLHAWKSSLQILVPSNFKLFLLVTLKKIMSTFKSYLKYGWPFILIVAFGTGMAMLFNEGKLIFAFKQEDISALVYVLAVIGMYVYLFAYAFCNFLVAIFARPSVSQKNCAYMRTFISRYFIGYILLNFLFVIISAQFAATTYSGMPDNIVQHFLVLLWYITSLFGVLFYLDLGGQFGSIFKSIWFAIKMTIYNLPLVALAAGVLLLGARIGYDQMQIFSYLHLIVYPFLFCFFTTLYTKRVHDQARLYQGN